MQAKLKYEISNGVLHDGVQRLYQILLYLQNVTRFHFIRKSVISFIKGKGKGKVFPLQARCGPEGG